MLLIEILTKIFDVGNHGFHLILNSKIKDLLETNNLEVQGDIKEIQVY